MLVREASMGGKKQLIGEVMGVGDQGSAFLKGERDRPGETPMKMFDRSGSYGEGFFVRSMVRGNSLGA